MAKGRTKGIGRPKLILEAVVQKDLGLWDITDLCSQPRQLRHKALFGYILRPNSGHEKYH